jgi:uncharacterized protein (DUF952 family)
LRAAASPAGTLRLQYWYRQLLKEEERKVLCLLIYDLAPDGGNELFPHIYGPLETSAVERVVSLRRNADGSFRLPPEI